jgi:hypothetical protein
MKCFRNTLPIPVSPDTIPTPDPELFLTTEPKYRIGGDGYEGWITDLVVISRILTQAEITNLKSSKGKIFNAHLVSLIVQSLDPLS